MAIQMNWIAPYSKREYLFLSARCFLVVEAVGLLLGSLLVGCMVVDAGMIKGYLDALFIIVMAPLVGLLITVVPAVVFSLLITVIAIHASRSSRPIRRVLVASSLLTYAIWSALLPFRTVPDIDDGVLWFASALVAACLSGCHTVRKIQQFQLRTDGA